MQIICMQIICYVTRTCNDDVSLVPSLSGTRINRYGTAPARILDWGRYVHVVSHRADKISRGTSWLKCGNRYISGHNEAVVSMSVHVCDVLYVNVPSSFCSHENLAYQCGECSVSFDRPSALQLHVQQYHCGLCATTCESLADLKQHIQAQKPHQCAYFPLCFDTAVALQEHVDENLKLYKCGYCKQGFALPDDLQQHLSAECDSNKCFQCGDCSQSFSTISALTEHIQPNSPSGKTFQCQYCDH